MRSINNTWRPFPLTLMKILSKTLLKNKLSKHPEHSLMKHNHYNAVSFFLGVSHDEVVLSDRL